MIPEDNIQFIEMRVKLVHLFQEPQIKNLQEIKNLKLGNLNKMLIIQIFNFYKIKNKQFQKLSNKNPVNINNNQVNNKIIQLIKIKCNKFKIFLVFNLIYNLLINLNKIMQ